MRLDPSSAFRPSIRTSRPHSTQSPQETRFWSRRVRIPDPETDGSDCPRASTSHFYPKRAQSRPFSTEKTRSSSHASFSMSRRRQRRCGDSRSPVLSWNGRNGERQSRLPPRPTQRSKTVTSSTTIRTSAEAAFLPEGLASSGAHSFATGPCPARERE